MKSFIISIICLGTLLACWFVFADFADDTISGLTNDIENELLVQVEDGDWDSALLGMEELTNRWHHYKKIYTFFLSTDAINQTDYSIARTKYYIKCKDASNATGELACIKEQLYFLHFNETVALENIF